jgi:cytochrome c biogenesis protein CcdA
MARQVGIVLGVAILVTILGSPAHSLASLITFQHATIFTATAAILAGFSALLLIRARHRSRSNETSSEAIAAGNPPDADPIGEDIVGADSLGADSLEEALVADCPVREDPVAKDSVGD